MTLTPKNHDVFGARDTFETGAGLAGIYRLGRLEEQGLCQVDRLPFSIRVLLESVLRNCDGYQVTEQDVKNLAGWSASQPAPAGQFAPVGSRSAGGRWGRCSPA